MKGQAMQTIDTRPEDIRLVARFLETAVTAPSALVIEGEPGIGKTTLWLDGVERARECQFTVLSAQAAATESVLAYSSLADLLGSVDDSAFAALPAPQRVAMDRVLLRGDVEGGAATDPRTVAAGLLSVLERIAEQTPVLVAIDDLQWLDGSSRNAIAFCTRRLSGPVALLCTLRSDPTSLGAASWLTLRRPDAASRIKLRPLILGSLHAVILKRLGLSLPRPTMVRIHEISGGNPFYALELARAIGDHTSPAATPLPATLAELVLARIGRIDTAVQELLLVMSCVAAPSVDLIARVSQLDEDRVVEMLEEAEAQGIVAIDGQWVRFGHPLLATGVYTSVAPAQRRAAHRRLADIVTDPELRARHLALGVTRADAQIVQALDVAADSASVRGAPAAAAELVDLALKHGGDTPERRIKLSRHYFNAGDAERARTTLGSIVDSSAPDNIKAQALVLLGALETIERSHGTAADALERAYGLAGEDLALQVQILVPLSYALYNTGRHADAGRRIDDAVLNADRLGQPDLLSHALSMRCLLRCYVGSGVDAAQLQRALDLDTGDSSGVVVYRPRMHHAMLLSIIGQQNEAEVELAALRRQCAARGEEGDLNYVAFHSVLNEIWRGNFADAESIAEEAIGRAGLHDGELHRGAALIMRAHCAAYMGREQDCRRDATEATAAVGQSESSILTGWPVKVLGFLELSLGNSAAALEVLTPLLRVFEGASDATEIYVASFLPDAAQAMMELGRPLESEPIIDALERNGARLDRPWMSAVGARCRAMFLAAQGDLKGATVAAQAALEYHGRMAMPFERARTLLVLGQLERRQRMKMLGTLQEALDIFEELNTPLWADRVRIELARSRGTRDSKALTASEQRVAELVSQGMTNREVAAQLFISPKTVEVNMTRVYRKLGIGSRAELGRLFAGLGEDGG
jgi:DNA-binding CsgD family transcriptional regulator/tetratricopeptide (TPR) repeat protein